jgi:predicted alpha/beta-fold hydrolase
MYALDLVMQSPCHLSGLSGAGVPLTSPQLYSSCHTDDLRQALLYISHRYPRAPLLGLGFSLGANVLTRYVAEEGEKCRLVSACALACVCLSPLNIVMSLRTSSSRGISQEIQMRASMLISSSVRSLPLILPAAYIGVGYTAISMLKDWVET